MNRACVAALGGLLALPGGVDDDAICALSALPIELVRLPISVLPASGGGGGGFSGGGGGGGGGGGR